MSDTVVSPKKKAPKIAMTGTETRASVSLSLLFAVRMLGLFLLTPVFADAAKTLVQGDNPALIGMAIGAYGLTQAIMQIPMGIWSDRYGRRPVIIIGMLFFIAGGLICAYAPSVSLVAVGRGVQGFGAVSAAITAWVADATRVEVRTRAMAMVGGSIALSFALSLVLSPLITHLWGLHGLFWAISLLGFFCLLLAVAWVPSAPRQSSAIDAQSRLKVVLKNKNLLRLDVAMFGLHFILMCVFLVIPPALTHLAHIQVGQLWEVYLTVIIIALVIMTPIIIVVETKHQHKKGLLLSMLTMAVTMLLMLWGTHSLWPLLVALLLFFVLFNVLEALLPSMVSRLCPAEHKGLAMGLFNMSQSIGVVCGGVVGGLTVRYGGWTAVFILTFVLSLLIVASTQGLRPPQK